MLSVTFFHLKNGSGMRMCSFVTCFITLDGSIGIQFGTTVGYSNKWELVMKQFITTGDTEADVKAPSDVGRSKRAADETKAKDIEGQYKEEDVYYVADTPRVRDGKLQVAVVVKDGDGMASTAD